MEAVSAEEEEVTARCETDPSLPPASIQWRVEGERVEASTEVRPAPGGGGGFISVSTVRWRPGQGRSVRLQCSGLYKDLSLSEEKYVEIISKLRYHKERDRII